ncbi:alpha/beta-hydrolase [Panus rudis PR-1116 ss-1]|nr:alpha/beta-hydrolase [Panus rudis PR-1116 ss-1]
MVVWSLKTLSRFLTVSGLLAIAVASDNASSAAHIVDLGYAKYAGNLSYSNTVAYLGLPYAEPPVGDRRFRAPLPLNTARVHDQTGGKVVDATSYPEPCIQGTTGAGDAGGAGSEDCLKVNVYAPAGAKKGDKLPVLVYIHGGGYRYGNPANWPFDHWVNQVPHVVIVSVYYRLTSFGFLSHPAFASNPSLADLNAGFLDQTEALRWVQKHIDAFGGDPHRVTINGQSAGASSVELHLVAPNQDGLFHGAIAQSVYRTPLPSPQQQEPLFNHYAAQAGCGSGSISTQIACLRNASISAIARAEDAPFNGSYNSFVPVIDGKSITEFPTVSLLNGRFQRVPLIVGATSNETSGGSGSIPDVLHSLFPGLSDTDLQRFEQEYPLSDFSSPEEQHRTAAGESEFRCGREIMGNAYASAKTTAYAYRYNQANPTTSPPGIVEHAAENWMMFKGTNTGFNGTTTFSPMTPLENAFASELIAYWLSFVRTGNPNTFKLARSPEWPQFTTKNKVRIVLQEWNSTVSSGNVVENDPKAQLARCDFVASFVQKQQN